MMRVSQRLDCALRAAVELARGPLAGRGRVSAGEVASRIGSPRRFTEQQLTTLGRVGIVECRRGSGGGCALARDPSEVTLADIVVAVEGAVLDVPRVSGSAASEAWGRVSSTLASELRSVTLADIAAAQDALESARVPEYQI